MGVFQQPVKLKTMRDHRNIYIECTHTFFVGGNNGIRRVARSIANCAKSASSPNLEIIPIIWGGLGFFRLNKELSEKPHTLQRIRNVLSFSAAFLLGKAYQVTPPLIRRPFTFLKRLICAKFQGQLHPELFYFLLGAISFPVRFVFGKSVPLAKGDIVVLIDSTWNSNRMLDYLFRMRFSHDIRVGVMIHDLFPLLMPEVCQEQTIEGFKHWFEQAVSITDFFLTNSHSTSDVLLSYLQQNALGMPQVYKVGSFKLGADIDHRRRKMKSSANADLIWNIEGIVLLAVGTIEPRKNYSILLEAFDILVKQGLPLSLLIVGKPGWKSDKVLQRIRTHLSSGNSLTYIADATDFDLEQAYDRANCLVCCSIAEGFGLPLVEGLLRGLPSIVSDIPPFREIGGENCMYFPPHSAEALAKCMKEWLNLYLKGKYRTKRLKWPNWEESTQLMTQTILQLAD